MKFAVIVPYVSTVTVVDAKTVDAIMSPPPETLQDENENGPLGAVDRDTATPRSNQPSPVGDVKVIG